MDFCDTFSSRSRRRSHHFLLCDLFLLSDLQRAVCVAVGTGVSVTCRSARRAVFCVDSVVCLVILYWSIKRIRVFSTLSDAEGSSRGLETWCTLRRGKARTLTRRHTRHDTRRSRRLFYSSFQALFCTDLPARQQRKSSEASSSMALHRTCSRTARHSAVRGCVESCQRHLRRPSCR